MQIEITKIYRSWTDKNKKPLKTKSGREYERVAIQTTEHGASWVSGFGDTYNRDWKVGDVVDIDVEKSGQYLNFKKPDPLKALEARVTALEQQVWVRTPEPDVPQETPPQEEEIHSEDIPF